MRLYGDQRVKTYNDIIKGVPTFKIVLFIITQVENNEYISNIDCTINK